MYLRRSLLLAILCLHTLWLATACSDRFPRQTLSGTVAAGAALMAEVRVKDSAGRERTAQSDKQGDYSVDITGLQAPLILQAQGQIGSREFLLHSAALASDFDGRVNITPLTDLILANIAAGNPATFYDTGSAGILTEILLNTQETLLQSRLQAVLTAAGVGTDVDLLRSGFSADHTGLDAVLDVLKFERSDAEKRVTITHRIENSSIVDDLSSDTDATTLTQTAANLDGLTELLEIKTAVDALGQLFLTQIPAADNPALLALFADDFYHNKTDMDTFIAAWRNQDFAGAEVSLSTVDVLDTANGYARVNIDFYKGDTLTSYTLPMVSNNGAWRLHGNQQRMPVEVAAQMLQTYPYDSTNNQFGNPARSSGLHYYLDTSDTTVLSADLTGSGLDSAVSFAKCVDPPELVSGDCSATTNMLDIADQNLAALPARARYVLDQRDAADASLGQVIIYVAAPLAGPENVSYPELDNASRAALLQLSSGNIDLTATLPDGTTAESVELSYFTGAQFQLANVVYDANVTEMLANFVLPEGTTVISRLTLTAKDAMERLYKTIYILEKNIGG